MAEERKGIVGSGHPPCPDRIEVDWDAQLVSPATVKAWVAHLRSHGWTDKELGLVWLTRSRQGVEREKS